jgi:hypothetical protein
VHAAPSPPELAATDHIDLVIEQCFPPELSKEPLLVGT